MENTITKLTEAVAEIIEAATKQTNGIKRTRQEVSTMKDAVKIIQTINHLCDVYGLDVPNDATDSEIALSQYFDTCVNTMSFNNKPRTRTMGRGCIID